MTAVLPRPFRTVAGATYNLAVDTVHHYPKVGREGGREGVRLGQRGGGLGGGVDKALTSIDLGAMTTAPADSS